MFSDDSSNGDEDESTFGGPATTPASVAPASADLFFEKELRALAALELGARDMALKTVKLINPDYHLTESGRVAETRENDLERAAAFCDKLSTTMAGADAAIGSALRHWANWMREAGAAQWSLQQRLSTEVVEPLLRFANRDYPDLLDAVQRVRNRRRGIEVARARQARTHGQPGRQAALAHAMARFEREREAVQRRLNVPERVAEQCAILRALEGIYADYCERCLEHLRACLKHLPKE